MSVRGSLLINGIVVLAVLLGLSGNADAQVLAEHPSDLTPLWKAESFPRFTDAELALAGFPDPMHAWWWRSWRVMTDENGETFGPGSLCWKDELQPREGLVVEPGHIAYGHFDLVFNAHYKPCDLIHFIEIADWAEDIIADRLGLTVDDTLHVISPDDVDQYRQQSGQGTWRLHRLDGDRCVLQPIPVLMARTLDGHAPFMVVTDWILHHHFGEDLPRWLHQGLIQYISENGVHLVNYMNEFRDQGPILMSPPIVDALLQRGIDPDPNRDREMYRRASYSAFLMVWELVENEGGLDALREMLQLVHAGETLDGAALSVYGLDLAGLAEMLDPVVVGEPLGKYTHQRNPSIDLE